jgi:NAD(P)-dependent dehydrogenase (short-subunit alcohol dehydrogenase family)
LPEEAHETCVPKGGFLASNRVVLITGGSRGIGAATALLCAQQGYAVAISYAANAQAAEQVVQQIRAANGTAHAFAADVAHENQILQMFAQVEHRFGRIDALVNNAGIVAPQIPVERMSAARLQEMFTVNAIGSILCAREAIKRMSSAHGGAGGAIVNVSSAAAKHGSAGIYVDYAASKGAIDVFTLGLAREVATQGIRVNAVRPGFIETEIHQVSGLVEQVKNITPATVPMGRAGSAQEVAQAIVWLLSDAASYVTGTVMDVSGGR